MTWEDENQAPCSLGGGLEIDAIAADTSKNLADESMMMLSAALAVMEYDTGGDDDERTVDA